MTPAEIVLTPSSGNVFVDLGYSREDAAVLAFKARLLAALSDYVRGFARQEEAAAALDVAQPRISEIVNGKLSKFSSDILIKLCARARVTIPDLELETA